MILAADNLRITDIIIQNAVNNMDAAPVYDMAVKLHAAGADAIDINPGPLTSNPEEKMKFLVSSIQEVTDLPIILDTSNPAAIKAGISISKNKVIVNGFSPEYNKLEKILPIAAEFDADIIGYLLDPNGHPPSDTPDRLNIAVELYQKCRESGISEDRLIVDPVVAPLIWNDGTNRNMELLKIIRMLPDILGFPVKTIAGLSNLTSGIKDMNKRIILQKTYLSMLSASGLSIILMEMLNKSLVEVAKTCNLITSERPFSVLEL
ncbi:MAG: dihydropteroate synthase [Desulfobacteraceae bacterium]|jgi:5-methyltetrahydrofolate corrinoid/iron sulfur protein methyltransferase